MDQPEAKKRKAPGRDSHPGRVHKRAKFKEARVIHTQPSDAALKDGGLDLQAFLGAREFEIKALEDGMRKTKAASSSRAFQKVPRAMRRRTASHNVKRVPKRLRARAAREQAEDNTLSAGKKRPRTTAARIRAETAKRLGLLEKRRKKEAAQKMAAQKEAAQRGASPTGAQEKESPPLRTRPARPKIRRNQLNDPPNPKAKFRKRQLDKTWLPTHLWHAKRARMPDPKQPLWRFAIPLTPTEKCYRPTHRAANSKGAVIWDTSYAGTIGLYGSAQGIERVLRALGLTKGVWLARGHKWRAGSRSWSGTLSKERKGGRKMIGPATILWNAEASKDAPMAGDTLAAAPRQVLVRVHPSCFLELFDELLKLVKMQTPQLYIQDLRFEVGSIELTGPGSTEALLGVLHPFSETQGHCSVFRSLAGVTNPSSLPAGALLAFSVADPRLRYPPKKIQADGDMGLLETLAKWPADDSAQPSGLFDRNARFEASRLPSQKSINKRRESAQPGEALRPTPADPPIPVVVLASRPPAGGHAQGSWTLLAPWRCIAPIWSSLVHCPLATGGNPRFGGLDELRQVALEQGTPWFPADFPGTAAGAEWELEQREKRRREWDKRPKGKRVEWTSLDLGAGRVGEVGDGLACDWEFLFGVQKARDTNTDTTNLAITVDVDMDMDTAGESTAPTVQKVMPPHESLLPINQLSKPALSPPPKFSVLTVRLTLHEGVVTTCARIYRLPTDPPNSTYEVPSTDLPPAKSLPSDLREQWLSRLPSTPSKGSKSNRRGPTLPAPRMPRGADLATRKRLLAESLVGTPLPYPKTAALEHPLCPGEGDLIGFVTSGAFNLSQGKGSAIGSVSAERVGEERLCIVRNAGETVGWLARWEAV